MFEARLVLEVGIAGLAARHLQGARLAQDLEAQTAGAHDER